MKIEVEILPIEDAPKGCLVFAFAEGIGWRHVFNGENFLRHMNEVRPTHYVKGLPETLEHTRSLAPEQSAISDGKRWVSAYDWADAVEGQG